MSCRSINKAHFCSNSASMCIYFFHEGKNFSYTLKVILIVYIFALIEMYED